MINAKVLQAHNDLIRQLRAGDFQVVLSQSFNDELTTQLEALRDKEKDIRIILGNFNEIRFSYSQLQPITHKTKQKCQSAKEYTDIEGSKSKLDLSF